MSYYLILIPVAIAVFVIGQIWFGSRRDPLLARYHFSLGLLCVAALLMLAQVVCVFTLPNSSPFNPKHPETLSLVSIVILILHLQFSHRLKDRQKSKLK